MTVQGIGDNDDYAVDVLVNGSVEAQFTQQKDQKYDIQVHPSVEQEEHAYEMNFNLVSNYGMAVDNIDADEVRVIFHAQNPYSVELSDGTWTPEEQNWESGDWTIDKNGSTVATYGSVGDKSTLTHDTGWVSGSTTWTLFGKHTIQIRAEVYTRDTVPDAINTTAVNKS